jgi:hypothetical protein
MSSHLLCRNTKIIIYKTVILPVVLYGCVHGLSHRLRVFENKVNIKVKLSLCLTKHHAMKAYWGVEV